MQYRTGDKIQGGVDSFQEYNFGPTGVAQAVYDLLAGRTTLEVFALAEHPTVQSGKIWRLTGIGLIDIDGYKTFRYVGERWHPDGSGSFSVIGSGSRSADPAFVAATLMWNLRSGEPWDDQVPSGLSVYRVTELPADYDDWYWKNRSEIAKSTIPQEVLWSV